MNDLRQNVMDMIQAARENDDYLGTWFIGLGTYNGNRWAVCAAWMDYDNNDNWELYAKIGFQPVNSIMREYDIDWQMPYDKANGEVYDTELSNVDEGDVDWLLDEWEYIKANFIDEEG